jgi:very-short-patch-repair endonuclease
MSIDVRTQHRCQRFCRDFAEKKLRVIIHFEGVYGQLVKIVFIKKIYFTK